MLNSFGLLCALCGFSSRSSRVIAPARRAEAFLPFRSISITLSEVNWNSEFNIGNLWISLPDTTNGQGWSQKTGISPPSIRFNRECHLRPPYLATRRIPEPFWEKTPSGRMLLVKLYSAPVRTRRGVVQSPRFCRAPAFAFDVGRNSIYGPPL